VSGQVKHLDKTDFTTEKDCRKLYYAGEVLDGWSGLSCSQSQEVNDRVTYALEPSTGFYDSVTRAIENNKCSIVSARGTLSWYLDVSFGNGGFPEFSG
jgi:hypothetical protein